MKKIFFFLLISFNAFAQEDRPVAINPIIMERIEKQVNEQLIIFEKACLDEGYTAIEIEFIKDTFKVENILHRQSNIDYSYTGNILALQNASKSYEALMDKYYTKLMKTLGANEQKILMQTQKNWITYRDSEKKMMRTIGIAKYAKDVDSHDQLANGSYCYLLQSRVIALYMAYMFSAGSTN
jgi:uncharacterized protein YecT (DUF1311 family)